MLHLHCSVYTHCWIAPSSSVVDLSSSQQSVGCTWSWRPKNSELDFSEATYQQSQASFQGCFKDNFRLFAGFYFPYRWTFLLVYIFLKDFSAYYTTVGGCLLFILTLHTICQPYIKRAHNIIDALLIAHLVINNSLSLYNYHKSHNRRVQYGATVSPAIVQLVLIYLPLVTCNDGCVIHSCLL